MSDAVCIGPFAVPLPPPNTRHERKVFDAGSLVSQQRAMVRAAFSGRCSGCGVPRTAVRPRGAKWSGALYTYGCEGHVGRVVPYQLPPHGPEHPVDVHIVRVPRHAGRALDPYENGPFATKPIVDEATEQLWPKGPDGKPKGTPDDSAPWLRWSYGERLHRKAKNPRRMTQRSDWIPGPPDPPNKGTELCEIWIAPREDCQCYCGELRQVVKQWLGEHRRTIRCRSCPSRDGMACVLSMSECMLPAGRRYLSIEEWMDAPIGRPDSCPRLKGAGTGADDRLVKVAACEHEPCGCGRSMLPIRWARGEL